MIRLNKVFLQEAWNGKSISRTWMNLKIQVAVNLHGRVADLGCGRSPSYYRFLGYEQPPENILRIDANPANGPNLTASLENKLPLKSSCIQTVLLLNVLEHIYHPRMLIQEIARILVSNGRLVLYVPFLVQIHKDPDDYYRFSESALFRLLNENNFTVLEVGSCTGFWLVMADFFRPFTPTRILRTGLTACALILNRITTRLAPNLNQKYTSGYFCIAEKSVGTPSIM